MQRLEVSGEVRPVYGSSGVKRLIVWRAPSEKKGPVLLQLDIQYVQNV